MPDPAPRRRRDSRSSPGHHGGCFAPRHGHDGVAEFFALVAKGAIHDFVIHDLLSSDRQVIAQVTVEWTVPSGGRLRDEELHLWTFGPDGRVVALRHYVDTAKHLRADAGEDTTVRTP